ncbi:glucose-6-phosphate dehydrogenase, partial [Aquifex sp.]
MSSEDIPSRERINFVIFGGTGNLSRKKLIPAIYELSRKGKINLNEVLLLGRREEKFQEILGSFPEDFSRLLRFVKFFVEREESYKSLRIPEGLTIFYLALPPSLFKKALEGIGRFLNVKDKRIVIEKPFGLDLESAKELNRVIDCYFSEEEIFRIDHFLGKPQVQNILSFKFSNYIFDKVFNSEFVERVEVLALEKEGVEGREAYYEEVGALKDMVQNHILLLCALTAMDAPPS